MADLKKTGTIYGINGPVIYLEGDPGFQMNEMVYVGEENLIGNRYTYRPDYRSGI